MRAVCLQVAGLKYFDDMQQRIPRAEVEQVHEVVHGTVREVLDQLLGGLPNAERLHCRVTGSYIRGKPMTGRPNRSCSLPCACSVAGQASCLFVCRMDNAVNVRYCKACDHALVPCCA